MPDLANSINRQPVQPPYMHKIFRGLLHSLAFIQGHLCLPRSQSNRGGAIEIPLDKVVAGVQTPNLNMNGKPAPLLRMHPKWFQSQPWYMPEPQTVLGKIKTRVIVALGLHDSLPESKFGSEGYRLEEMVSCSCFRPDCLLIEYPLNVGSPKVWEMWGAHFYHT